jgi:hypothetical protein
MADSRTETGKIQDRPRALCNTRKKLKIKKELPLTNNLSNNKCHGKSP